MLDWFAAQRFAKQNGPLAGERRLCMFAGTGTPSTPGGPDSTPDKPDEDAVAKEARELREKQVVEHNLAAVRGRVFEMVEHEPGKAEAVFEKSKEVQNFLTSVSDIPSLEFILPSGELTNMRKYIKTRAVHPGATAKDKENEVMLDVTMSFLQQKKDAAAKIRATVETLAQWERGELTLEDFKKSMEGAFAGIDDFDDPVEKQIVNDALKGKRDAINAIDDAKIQEWNTADPLKRVEMRRALNKELGIPEMLNILDERLETWKEINKEVKNSMLSAMPKQKVIDDSTAAYISEALNTTFEEWNAGSLSLEELRTKAHHLYHITGLPGAKERLAEIDKAIVQTAATKDNEKKERIRSRINADLVHVKRFMQMKLGQWSQEKLGAIRAWEQGVLTNDKFAETMKHVYAAEGGDDVRQKLDAISSFVTTHGSKWKGNVSDRIEAQEDLKRVINLRGSCKRLSRWCEDGAPPVPQTATGGSGGTPSAPTAASADGSEPPKKPEEGKKKDGGDEPPNDDGFDEEGDGEHTKKKKGEIEPPKKDAPADIDPVALAAHHGGFFREMGIEFYSINDMIGGFKRVMEAYKHGFHERTVLKETAFASALGKGIPGWTYLSGEVKLSLEKAADNEKDKETSEFKQYLEERHVTFVEIFEGHGDVSMAHLQAEPPKARAVLEYAASRGWLYDITAAKSKHKMTTLGYDLTKVCSDWGTGSDADRKRDNYFIKLMGQNSSGIDDEKSHGKKKEQYTEKADLFIDAINHALDELNYWEAVGIAQRAIERGLKGEISPWIATTIMRRLREDPLARKYVSDAVLDQFGIICFTHTARTLSVLKVSRGKIGEWKKGGKYDDESFAAIDRKDEGVCSYAIKIEQKFKKMSGKNFDTPKEKANLDRLVAKVFAAQLVEVPGKPGEYITIFDNDLKGYVQNIADLNFQGGSNVGEEDDDYYQLVSDVITSDREVYKRIYELTGSGIFKNKPKTNDLTRNILNQYNVFTKFSPEAAANFLAIQKVKFEEWIYPWLTESRGGPAANEQLPSPISTADGRYTTGFAILGLINAGMISFDLIKKRCTAFNKGAPLLAQTLMEQMANPENDNPNQAEALKHLRSFSGNENYDPGKKVTPSGQNSQSGSSAAGTHALAA